MSGRDAGGVEPGQGVGIGFALHVSRIAVLQQQAGQSGSEIADATDIARDRNQNDSGTDALQRQTQAVAALYMPEFVGDDGDYYLLVL